ncbi:hypothetical protein BGZ61DRAFT_593874 [Ilyonectria robusta]|uniref:uncharacterized protein n=1 Tax=Ilyonectria robusta TaxID=1079257 RepID=UPI001E8CD5AE|nr:uncharacterized protein BGZ61DRAFT_593874 [Ilyonectria robusta]KAH8661089.1 hypothetical protein BGZ61DRAFT_593874 [Ilyonectria robusta]
MITLLSPHFVPQEVTEDDLALASLAWGFTIGFGWLTTWTATKQTKRIYERRGLLVFRSAYIWMIWLEILVCLIFSIICWLHLKGIIPPSFAFYFCILTTWALQVQFLLQIIINRCSILLTDPVTAYRLKVGVAVLITAVNISVYNIWIPARLQISERYIWINEWWDRVEKAIYLLVDGALNFYFIRVVQQNLVANGLTKYKSLVKFNMCIVGFSLSMDVLIISMMSLHNTFVYMQFHPFAYIVKLKIEMSMADLIGKIARQRQCGVISNGTFGDLETTQQGTVPSKSLTTTYSRTRVSTEGIRTVRGVDAVSIELQEGPDGSAAFNGRSKTNRDTGFLGQSSSSSLQLGEAIYTTEDNRIDVDAATSNHGESTCSVADSFDENGSARKDDDDERPLRY